MEAGRIRESGPFLKTVEAKMSTKIASQGEKLLVMRVVVGKIVEAADEAGGFASRKLGQWRPDQQVMLEEDLWNGNEPYFTELMENFHCAMEDAWTLADKNREAWYFVYGVPPISRRNSDINYVRRALKTTLRVAGEWLATHPEKKTWKEPGWVLTIIIFLIVSARLLVERIHQKKGSKGEGI
ncbi:MAG: hypothetical protein Q7S75_02250 [bacterium]|nr:hypothetical protein [bacterium]